MTIAKYGGICPGCGKKIYPGHQEITPSPAHYGCWTHIECADYSTIERKPAPVCPKCFIEKPCECDDL